MGVVHHTKMALFYSSDKKREKKKREKKKRKKEKKKEKKRKTFNRIKIMSTNRNEGSPPTNIVVQLVLFLFIYLFIYLIIKSFLFLLYFFFHPPPLSLSFSPSLSTKNKKKKQKQKTKNKNKKQKKNLKINKRSIRIFIKRDAPQNSTDTKRTNGVCFWCLFDDFSFSFWFYDSEDWWVLFCFCF